MPRLLALLAFLPALACADEFDRFDGRPLAEAAKGKDVKRRERLTYAELAALPTIFRDTRAALVVVATDQGNPARVLVAPALRNPPPGAKGEPVPVLILERFDTFEAGPATSKVARGREVMLFDGFRFDLDTGQVVPDGQGGDLQFIASGEAGPRLVPIGGAKLSTLKTPPDRAETAPGQPSPGRAVVPADFAGEYRLFANGQWTGTLELNVGDGAVVTGRFRSAQTGSAYPVTGQAAAERPHAIRFAISFPRTRQEYDGFLFTEGKGAIAGTVLLQDRPFGFFAIRQGGPLAPEGGDDGKAPPELAAPKPEGR